MYVYIYCVRRPAHPLRENLMKYLIRWTGRLSGWIYVLVTTDFNNVIQENPWEGEDGKKNPSYNINIGMQIYSLLLPYLSKSIKKKKG